MRVLHVTNAWPTERIPEFGIFIKDQVESLRIAGVDTDVFFINGREKGPLEYLRCIPRLRRASLNADIIHCHHVYSALVVLAACIDRPFVVSFMNDGVHQFNRSIPRPIARGLLALISRRASRCIYKTAIPESRKSDIRNVYLPNGVDLNVFKPMDRDEAKGLLGLDVRRRYLLFVSFFDRDRPAKRYPVFSEVLRRLRSDYRHHDLEEFCMIREPREKVPVIFNACTAHLLVSSFEGSPNSVKEALACNTPVVATRVGSVADLLEGVDGCYLCDDDPGRIAAAVDKVLRAPRPETSGALTEKQLTTSVVAQRLTSLYRDIDPRL